jgi:hypothetical protein
MGALSSLNLASNMLCGIYPNGYGTYDASGNTASSKYNTALDFPCLGIIALASAIPDMGALMNLDIRSNAIGAEQERDLQRICMAGGITLNK